MAALNATNSARRLKAAETRRQVVELRMEGATYALIGARLGISQTAAHRHCERAMAEARAEIAAAAEELRSLQYSRLERLLQAVWNSAIEGNHPAIDRALRILEREAKLLGLDAPAKVAPTTPEGSDPYDSMSDAELAERIEKLLSKARA